MHSAHLAWVPGRGWQGPAAAASADLVLYFGGRDALADGAAHRALQAACPRALLLGCSTGGQILGAEVEDEQVVALALGFAGTRLRLATAPALPGDASRDSGAALGRALVGDGLAGVFLLSDGLGVNGSALVAGLADALGPDVPLAGGLAGDGARFATTLVGAGDLAPQRGLVGAIGFYGAGLRIGQGSAGGWDAFGPRRRITRAEGNVLLELDGAPALDLYERYLGEEAAGLPGTALLFPLRIGHPTRPGHEVVRTILGIDRDRRSMTFAGDVPEGWTAQLMRGDRGRLAEGAAEAARQAARTVPRAEAAILVSCIGRRLLMGQAVADETEAVAATLPPGIPGIGFYAYGEIAPHAAAGASALHNQTMTITLLAEAA
ncbi:FIST signal transduction protein [Paracraurococcus ruber]|uniref:Uncharacterized protein n=1 Tax=Paracraurococcus ruber TaxID=77675 RepID=A0ABS1D7A9_9PROT|nr:FIST N-terminal domain-containing protein [Paracraurococcus ruber]MBK1661952.1 hypothetical protein [Paracraurococcus ruber]TDG16505.1 hypothetical protein E2C05_29155 [Paracraurococcus ruber]